ncbi:MAG: OmpA family protein [Leeuwenhoekiella sp.]
MRKNLFLTLACLGLFGILQAQEVTTDDNQEMTNTNEYNRWSIEAGFGFTKPVRPMAPGYFSSTPSFYQVDLGTRYMFNEKAGLKLNLGMNSFENKEDSSNEYKTRLYVASLEGVINGGNLLGFRDWTNTLNFLVHAGGGYSTLVPSEPVDVDFSDGDQMLFVTAGITPQIKLTDHIVIMGDLSIFGNVRQDYTFDGTGKTKVHGFNGYYLDASAGITFYLGKNKTHADFYNSGGELQGELDSLEQRVTQIEDNLLDTDQDGVADYLDREPNTVSGVTVNTHGVATDQNKNGLPDELESSLDARYTKIGDGSNSGSDIIEKLINDGFVNVYFKFNSTQPEVYSYEAINYLIKYMKENTSSSADLIGYADEVGSETYNKTLSEKRAQKVYDILTASGIDGGRLSVTGDGEDTSVDKNSEPARQLVRRVTFKLNK